MVIVACYRLANEMMAVGEKVLSLVTNSPLLFWLAFCPEDKLHLFLNLSYY